MSNKSITIKDILWQLKADLIGKDSHRGITLTYAWLANQFGHFSLGFIPTLGVYHLLLERPTVTSPDIRASVSIAVFWLVFELINFLVPLILSKLRKEHTFPPAWANIAFDTFTDLCFFWMGTVVAVLFISFSVGKISVLLVLLLFLAWPSYHWFLTKLYLQGARYPFQLRLSQVRLPMSNGNKKLVFDYLNSQEEGKHLLIYGGRQSGKTSLSVALATELSIRHHTVFYTTAMKLFSLFAESGLAESRQDILWTWREASLLIIDDINPGWPVPRSLITADGFRQLIDLSEELSEVNRQVLKEKNVIWVIGAEAGNRSHSSSWEKMLLGIGIPATKISTVYLLD
ncbi:ATP-binding protein [Pedobacter sp. SYSU D00535]|uniref:ATP-binding protein n=1 Tax=Pedobacter sp. SYSU D00535 TaxID=2810308 RepID=UPI001A97BDA7|nr:ATP-binding protein [Pedobacter sp. SYSU D00535]